MNNHYYTLFVLYLIFVHCVLLGCPSCSTIPNIPVLSNEDHDISISITLVCRIKSM